MAAEIAFYRAHLDDGRDARSLASLRRRCGEVLRTELPQTRASELSLDAATAALLTAIEFTPFPDVRRVLEAARSRGYRLVVASNWDVSLHEVLARLGLAPLLDGIVTSAEVGARKPVPAVFERALVLAGALASEAIHVGDSIEEDVAGARRAGVEPVLLHRDGSPGPPGVETISSLDELTGIAP
jgi:putative hydrolase of the HAD superfamily